MNVPGRSRSTRSRAISPSVATPWYLRRNGPNRCALAIASTAMKPTLWRLPAYFAPGLPRPTKSSMASTARAPPYVDLEREEGADAPPHFLSDVKLPANIKVIAHGDI